MSERVTYVAARDGREALAIAASSGGCSREQAEYISAGLTRDGIACQVYVVHMQARPVSA